MKNTKYLIFTGLLLVFLFLGCEKNPVKNFRSPVNDAALNAWGDEWYIYDDKLRTGGGIMYYASVDNQTFDLSNTVSPYNNSKYCILYSWNGDNIYDYDSQAYETTWTGLAIISGSDWSDFDTGARDISAGNYTTCSFYAKGTLGDGVTVAIGGPGSNEVVFANADEAEGEEVPLTTDWTERSFTFSESDIKVTKIFFSFLFSYNKSKNSNLSKGTGGSIYIDNIVYK